MAAETDWISVFLSLTWKQFRGFFYRTVLQSKFNDLLSQYDGYTGIFTNGFKIGEGVGATAIMATRLCKKLLLNYSSVSSAEARGILLALDNRHGIPVYRQSAPVPY